MGGGWFVTYIGLDLHGQIRVGHSSIDLERIKPDTAFFLDHVEDSAGLVADSFEGSASNVCGSRVCSKACRERRESEITIGRLYAIQTGCCSPIIVPV